MLTDTHLSEFECMAVLLQPDIFRWEKLLPKASRANSLYVIDPRACMGGASAAATHPLHLCSNGVCCGVRRQQRVDQEW